MLGKNDYVDHKTVAPGLGSVSMYASITSPDIKRNAEEFEAKGNFKILVERILRPMYARSRSTKKLQQLLSTEEGRKGLEEAAMRIVRALKRWRTCASGGVGP
jgi:hypothetical protein